AVSKFCEQCGQRAFAADRVTIQSRHAGGWTYLLHLGFDAFGPVPCLFEIRPGAERTHRGYAHRVVAIVAARTPRRAFAVHDERDAAVGTVEGPRTLPAENGGGESTAVQQHQRL